MSNANVRAKHMEATMDCVINSVRQGDNVYVHCVSGLSRGPVAAMILSAELMGISMDDARWWVNHARNVKDERGSWRNYGHCEDMDGPWIAKILRYDTAVIIIPTCFACDGALHKTPGGYTAIVHAANIHSDVAVPLCSSGKGASEYISYPLSDIQTTVGMAQAARQFGGNFCEQCEPLLSASSRAQVGQLWTD